MRDKYNVSDYIIYFTGLQSSIPLPVKYNATYKEKMSKIWTHIFENVKIWTYLRKYKEETYLLKYD